ncbi:MAG: fumarate hydratase C-terminal domain-containing protein [Firmicutes bacterium]|nr:fumarate hydratase C-terminal domain-containing protein [Bacillota bacterium]
MEYILNWPADCYKLTDLRSGDVVHLSGTIYTARDAAHRRLVELLDAEEDPPIDLHNCAIYYAGPAPCPPGHPSGSIGPTTSGRMDIYKEKMMKAGMRLMIGKGKCFPQLKELCKEYKAVYLAAFGGVAALSAKAVKSSELIAWPELGAEALTKLEVENMLLVVINDCRGHDYYDMLKDK